MSRWIDISTPIDDRLPIFPGSPGFSTSKILAIADGDDANATRLDTDVHIGTHVDVPRHFVPDGATLDEVGLDPFVGPCVVADLGDSQRIGRPQLEALSVAPGTKRLLLRTSNSLERRLREPRFNPDHAALTAEGARWVVERGLALIGIDYVSIQRYEDPPDTHRILLGAGVAIIEGLDLERVAPGSYQLVCLPVHLVGAEAAPARAVVFPIGDS